MTLPHLPAMGTGDELVAKFLQLTPPQLAATIAAVMKRTSTRPLPALAVKHRDAVARLAQAILAGDCAAAQAAKARYDEVWRAMTGTRMDLLIADTIAEAELATGKRP